MAKNVYTVVNAHVSLISVELWSAVSIQWIKAN